MKRPGPLMRIQLSDERKEDLLERLQAFHREAFDEELSRYRAETLLQFLVHALGAPIYNQAIQDARGYLQDRLDDLDAEFYEPEERD